MDIGAAVVFGLFFCGWTAFNMMADLFAVIWFGRWLALTTTRPNLAGAMTIFFVLILPSFAICGLYLFVDLVLALYASSQLRAVDLRRTLERVERKAAASAR